MSKRPNILVITTDQQHHKMMSCAGNSFLSTPNMDRIAEAGVRFEHAYCANPVCVPQRFSWWTGRMPSSIGMRGNRYTGDGVPEIVHETAMGHVLTRAGYQAYFGGKSHVPGGLTPQSMGFEYFCKDERDRLAVESSALVRELAGTMTPWFMALSFINPHDICYHAIRAFEESDFDRLILSNGATELAELDEVLSTAPSDLASLDLPPLPENHEPQEDEPEGISALLEQRGFRKSARERWGEFEWRLHRWAYHRLTERVDDQIGVVMDALRETGQDEETVVIFTSDHGDHDGSHKLEHKTIFYDEAARIPLIVQDPDMAQANRGSVIRKGLVQTGIDLTATICDYLEIVAPKHNVGVSFRSTANGSERTAPREGAYAENEVSRMYVTERYKYVRYDSGANGEQLYDLEADPGETRNWIGDSEAQGVAGILRQSLTTEIEQHEQLVVSGDRT